MNGRLGMTRSIGDTEFKGYGVVAEPYIRSLEVNIVLESEFIAKFKPT